MIPLLAFALVTATLRPIDGDQRRTLQAFYKTTKIKPSDVSTTELVDNGVRKITLTFPSQTGDTVHGILYEPVDAKSAPCVLVEHGFSGDKGFANLFAPTLLSHGMAVAAIDAPHHGERETEGDRAEIASILADFKASPPGLRPTPASQRTLPDLILSAEHGDILDSRRLLDYLQTRPELDRHRIGLIAQSMGSMEGVILVAVDHRIRCASFEVGGAFGPQSFDATPTSALSTSTGLYAPYVDVPVLSICATHDSQMPRTAADALNAALPSSVATIRWYIADHWLNDSAHRDAAQWVIDHLSNN